MDAYTFGVIIGSLFTGSILGAIPAICGAIKGKIQLAIIGFFACLVSSFILGMILGIPVCAIFLWLIFKKEDINDGWFCQKCGTKNTVSSNFCKKCGEHK